MPRKQRVRVEVDEEDDELPSDLVPSRKIARKLRKQRLKDEDEDEDDELMPYANTTLPKSITRHANTRSSTLVGETSP